MKLRISVVDDDAGICRLISAYLRDFAQTDIKVFTDPRLFLEDMTSWHPHIVILDVKMPEMDGIGVMKKVKEFDQQTEIIIITGEADKDIAIQALRMGAFDLLEKPFEKAELTESVKRTMRFQEISKERDNLAYQVSLLSQRESKRWGIDALIGESPQIKSIRETIKLLQQHETTPVLIVGESGTGKELVARAIHYGSNRAMKPFIAVNCAAMPLELAESQLFGHVKGAFTGATANRKGSFEMADGGTLFLDELADMHVAAQAKLLRVLEDQQVQPVGASYSVHVNVRIIAATNSDIEERMQKGEFRTDLYHRLAVFRINTPPLREHKEDIPLLAEHFMLHLCHEMGVPHQKISSEVMNFLINKEYPGNVRELRNILERALIVSGGTELQIAHFGNISEGEKWITSTDNPPIPSLADKKVNLEELIKHVEKEKIEKALKETSGNIAKAARLLGISRPKLYRKIADLKISV